METKNTILEGCEIKGSTVEGEDWGILMDQIRKLRFTLLNISEEFERVRNENIRQRYELLLKAHATGYAPKQTMRYIAELGAEFGANKAFEYSGSGPFKES
mgnify:CR=1 FL=1